MSAIVSRLAVAAAVAVVTAAVLVAAGVFAARRKHQAMRDWNNLILGYYGIRPDIFGARDLMPMPAFRDDISWTSGPRGFSFSFWNNLNKWGNNDANFKMSMMNMEKKVTT